MSMLKRLRLYGKIATEEEIAQEVANLLLGDESKNRKPLKVVDVAKALDFTRMTIYRYIDKAVSLKYLELDPDTKQPKLPERPPEEEFTRFDEKHPFVNDPLIADWKQDLLTRKQGAPIDTWKVRINSVESICNTLKINPRALLISAKQTEKYLKNYIDLYRAGKADLRQDKKATDIQGVTYKKAQALRDFVGFYGITWKRGVGGVMSQKVVGHAKYGDVRLSDDQLEQADQYLSKKYGLDSDVYRWFFVGVESCARFTALSNMTLDIVKHTSKLTQKVTYIMTAYESKTKHIAGGKWLKYITRPRTQQSLDLLKSTGGSRIYDSTIPKKKLSKMMKLAMTDLFKHLEINIAYFYSHTTHVLRHIGAHYWLNKYDYNYGLVAKIGGWNTIDELRKSYGEMPPEKVLELLEKEQSKS